MKGVAGEAGRHSSGDSESTRDAALVAAISRCRRGEEGVVCVAQAGPQTDREGFRPTVSSRASRSGRPQSQKEFGRGPGGPWHWVRRLSWVGADDCGELLLCMYGVVVALRGPRAGSSVGAIEGRVSRVTRILAVLMYCILRSNLTVTGTGRCCC